MASSDTRRGLWTGIATYLLWGLVPLYYKALGPVPALEIVAHRVLWSVAMVLPLLLLLGRGAELRRALSDPRQLGWLVASALLVSTNWLIYVWAISAHKLLAASLGYFLNPLVNIALGVVFLGERLSGRQKLAVAVAGIGVAIALAGALSDAWVALALALSFGTYGLIRKRAPLDSLLGLTAETLVLLPLAAGLFLWMPGPMTFGQDLTTSLLLAASGLITVVPLYLFASAARLLPYSTLGMLQYIAPSMIFVMGLLLFGEPLRPAMLAAFIAIWGSLALFASDAVSRARASSR